METGWLFSDELYGLNGTVLHVYKNHYSPNRHRGRVDNRAPFSLL